MADLQSRVDELWEHRAELSPADTDAAQIVEEAIGLLDSGQLRVAEVDAATDEVVVHEWLKKSILMFFSLRGMETIEHGPFEYADKLPLKHDFAAAGVRVVPGASARSASPERMATGNGSFSACCRCSIRRVTMPKSPLRPQPRWA